MPSRTHTLKHERLRSPLFGSDHLAFQRAHLMAGFALPLSSFQQAMSKLEGQCSEDEKPTRKRRKTESKVDSPLLDAPNGTPSGEAAFSGVIVSKGLQVKMEWLDQVLAGSKTMELRSQRSRYRGSIGLVETVTGLLRHALSLKAVCSNQYYILRCVFRFQACCVLCELH